MDAGARVSRLTHRAHRLSEDLAVGARVQALNGYRR